MKHKTLSNAFRKAGYEVKTELRQAVTGKPIVHYFAEDGVVITRWTARSPDDHVTPYVVNRLKEDPRHLSLDYFPGKFPRTIKETLRVFKEEAASQSFTDKPDKIWPQTWDTETPEN
jgi:hypothetical protein